eukprot:2461772-Karenia_brevis.AAC.1
MPRIGCRKRYSCTTATCDPQGQCSGPCAYSIGCPSHVAPTRAYFVWAFPISLAQDTVPSQRGASPYPIPVH